MDEDIGEVECKRLKEVTEDDLKSPNMNTWKGYASENVCERRNFIFDKVQKRHSGRQFNQQTGENMNMALRVELIIKRKKKNLQLGCDGLLQLISKNVVSR